MILTDIYPVFIVPLVLLLVIFMLFYSVKPILFIFLFQMAKCDGCKRQGKLSESIKWQGNIKRFCNLLCVLEFCDQEVMNDPLSQNKGKVKLG